MKASTTCWELIRGAAEGRDEAVDQFCSLYRPLVIDFLRRRWSGGALAQEIEDAAQETMMECMRERGALENARQLAGGRFRGFLHGVTMNVARRTEERKSRPSRLQSDESLGEDDPADENTPSKDFDRSWALNVVRQAREALERRAQEAGGRQARRATLLRMRFFEDLPIRSIAARLGEDAADLHHEYAKARREFKDALEDVLRFENDGSVDLDTEMGELIAHLG